MGRTGRLGCRLALAWGSALLVACDSGAGKSAGGGGSPGAPAPGGAAGEKLAAAPAGAGAVWALGEQPSFKARWKSSGAATRGAELTGTLYVGPRAVRLDIDNHPNAGGPRSLVRVHGEDDLWEISAAEKGFDRALSGDWEHQVVPTVVEADDAEDVAKGNCPFGYAKPEDCRRIGAGEVAGRKVEKWQHRKRTLWVDPLLRVALREEYTPFRNNPEVQRVELTDLALGAQDPALFTMPAGFECKAGGFCNSAPR